MSTPVHPVATPLATELLSWSNSERLWCFCVSSVAQMQDFDQFFLSFPRRQEATPSRIDPRSQPVLSDPTRRYYWRSAVTDGSSRRHGPSVRRADSSRRRLRSGCRRRRLAWCSSAVSAHECCSVNNRQPRIHAWSDTPLFTLYLSQSCPWVHFVWPDPTQPIIWLTQPNPTQQKLKNLDPTQPNPWTTLICPCVCLSVCLSVREHIINYWNYSRPIIIC